MATFSGDVLYIPKSWDSDTNQSNPGAWFPEAKSGLAGRRDDFEVSPQFLSCHPCRRKDHDERIRINIRKLGHQCQGFSTLTSWISWSRNLSVTWSTLLLFIYVYLCLSVIVSGLVPLSQSEGLPTAKTALNQPPEPPSLGRGQHLKDACISTPWSMVRR